MGFYNLDNELVGRSVREAKNSIKATDGLEKLVHDHIYVDWVIDREGIASAIAYEGLLNRTLDDLAEEALESIRDNTNEVAGPILGEIYWWESSFSSKPRPPSNAVTANNIDFRGRSQNLKSAKKSNVGSKKKPKKSKASKTSGLFGRGFSKGSGKARH